MNTTQIRAMYELGKRYATDVRWGNRDTEMNRVMWELAPWTFRFNPQFRHPGTQAKRLVKLRLLMSSETQVLPLSMVFPNGIPDLDTETKRTKTQRLQRINF